MNADLKRLPDGTHVASIDLQHWDGVKHHVGLVRVYWPFVVFEHFPRQYNLTHAPTGQHVTDTRTLKEAVAKIHAFRAAADFDFTSPKGAKAKRAKQASKHLIPRLMRVG